MVGATRESVNKSLAILRNNGLVYLDGAEITIHDSAALGQIVQDRGR